MANSVGSGELSSGGGGQQLRAAELVERASVTSRWLDKQAGVRRGERLVLALESGLDYLELMLAGCELGCQIVVVPPTVSAATLSGIVASMQPAALVFDADNARIAAADVGARRDLGFGASDRTVVRTLDVSRAVLPARAAQSNGPALSPAWWANLPPAIFYTSGSTSTAKGAVLSWTGIVERGDRVLELYGARAGEWLMPILPLSHVYGLYLTLGAMKRGVSCVFERESVRPAVLGESLARHSVGYVVCPPMTGNLLFGRGQVEPELLRNMRVLSMGGAATTELLARRLVDNLPGVRVYLSYGLVETYSTICANEVSAPSASFASVGPFRFGAHGEVRDPSTNVRVPDGAIGELCVGGIVTSGYFIEGKLETDGFFTPDGLFRTGDLVSLDDRGHVFIRGRLKEMINAGGLSIAPDEVEAALKTHPDVLDCGVVAEERDALEYVCAAVVLRHGTKDATSTIDALYQHCKAHLSPKMVPRRIVAVESIPRGVLGKIIRPQLRALCATEGA